MLKNILNLEGVTVLNRKQQKEILGGASNGCAYQGGNGYYGSVGPNLSFSHVEWAASQTGGYYCCASCCSVGWLSQGDKEYIGC